MQRRCVGERRCWSRCIAEAVEPKPKHGNCNDPYVSHLNGEVFPRNGGGDLVGNLSCQFRLLSSNRSRTRTTPINKPAQPWILASYLASFLLSMPPCR
jgi:hypothetical protein